jgi:hypothetical protein
MTKNKWLHQLSQIKGDIEMKVTHLGLAKPGDPIYSSGAIVGAWSSKRRCSSQEQTMKHKKQSGPSGESSKTDDKGEEQ